MVPRVVVDTNVLAGAFLGPGGENRRVLRACLKDEMKPLVGQALFLEYEDVLGRERLFRRSRLSGEERQELFQGFLSVCEWVQVYYLWRPNLPDEADNHLVELAVAGDASIIVTHNVSDFRGAELRFPQIRILTPREIVREIA